MNTEHMKKLYLELSTLENRGVTIWLEGYPSDSGNVANQIRVNEQHTYMRDYVFDEGVLKEIHFDKIDENKS